MGPRAATSAPRSLGHSVSMHPDDQTGNDLRRLRLRLVIDQANRYEAGQISLPDLATGLDSLISALRNENGDEDSVDNLQPIWGGIEIVNAFCLDEDREPTATEHVDVLADLARIREAAGTRLEQLA
jgi:hypothetical protein